MSRGWVWLLGAVGTWLALILIGYIVVLAWMALRLSQ